MLTVVMASKCLAKASINTKTYASYMSCNKLPSWNSLRTHSRLTVIFPSAEGGVNIAAIIRSAAEHCDKYETARSEQNWEKGIKEMGGETEREREAEKWWHGVVAPFVVCLPPANWASQYYLKGASIYDSAKFLTPFPPCHCHKSADFVPCVCFLGTPPPTGDVIYGSPLRHNTVLDFHQGKARGERGNFGA